MRTTATAWVLCAAFCWWGVGAYAEADQPLPEPLTLEYVFSLADDAHPDLEREQAAMAFSGLRVGAILAVSFARIFYRNVLNLGVPALILPQATEINAQDQVRVDAEAGRVENLTQNVTYGVEPIPAHLMEMINAGGLMPHLKRRIAAGELR